MIPENPQALADFLVENLNLRSGWKEMEGFVVFPKRIYFLYEYRFADKTYKELLETQGDATRKPLMALAMLKIGDRWYYNKSQATKPWWNQTCEIIAAKVKDCRPVNLGALMFAPVEKMVQIAWGMNVPDIADLKEFYTKWMSKEIEWTFPQEDKDDWYKFFAYLNTVVSPNDLKV